MEVKKKYLYRFTDSGNWDVLSPRPTLSRYEVLEERETTYIFNEYGYSHDTKLGRRWVYKSGTNIFAWDTVEKALFNYSKRKQKHIEILTRQLTKAKAFSSKAQKMLEVKDTLTDKETVHDHLYPPHDYSKINIFGDK